MAKFIVQNDTDPGIAIILEEDDEGYGGTCTECGTVIHHHRQEDARQDAEIHVDRHDWVEHGGWK